MGRSKKENNDELETTQKSIKKVNKNSKQETKKSPKEKTKSAKDTAEKNNIQNIEKSAEPIVAQLSSTETNQSSISSPIQPRPKKKGLVLLIIILITIGLLTIAGIIIIPKVLEMLEEESEETNKITETVEVKLIPYYNEEVYVIEGIPDTIKVDIIGKKKAVEKAVKNSDTEIKLDLSSYQPSKEKTKIKINYTCPEKVECEVQPSSIKVSIQSKAATTKQLKYKIIENELAEYITFKTVTLSHSEVIIKGSQDILDSINDVTALIDMNDLIDNRSGTLLQMGTRNIDNLKLVAYDKKGQEVKNIDIVPSTVSAQVEIVSNTKEVPLNLEFRGELAPGRAISSIIINGIDINSYKITVYGDEETLENLNYLPVEINLDGVGATDSKSFKVTLAKPVGVTKIKEEEVNIEVKFANATQKNIEIQGIQTKNIPEGFIANISSPEDAKVSVQVIGTSEVLDNLDLESLIYAYVDLADLTEGPHSLPVKLDVKDSRLKCIVTKNINVIINKQ